MIYRNPAHLRLAAKVPVCMWPGCMTLNAGQIVAAHSNRLGKGMGMKAPDWAWAALCNACHYELDQGKDLDREERWWGWVGAYFKTQEWLWNQGLLCVAMEPTPHVNPPKKPSKKIAKGRPLQSGRKLQSKNEWPTGREIAKRPFPSKVKTA